MTALTLIYACDSNDNFADTKTGKVWDMPEEREFVRKTISGKSVICGRKTFENNYERFAGAGKVTVLSRTYDEKPKELFQLAKMNAIIECRRTKTLMSFENSLLMGLYAAQNGADLGEEGNCSEIFCVGGRQTIEALSPFASKLIVTEINDKDDYEEFPYCNPYKIHDSIGGRQSIWRSEEVMRPMRWGSFLYRRVILSRYFPIEF